MKRRRFQLVATTAIVACNAPWWLIPSNVVYLIASEREVLLGRYSEGRFTGMLIAALLSWVALSLVWVRPDNLKRRAFKVIAISIGIAAGILIAELAVRILVFPRYVRTGDVYHRRPHSVYTEVIKDVPYPLHSYPWLPPGYPDVRYTLTVDAQGFRNRNVPDRCDVVILGDSFAEGSNISDDGIWPALYAAKSGRCVYNLGMGGGDPSTYVETLRKFGAKLSPAVVVCLLYEGNDFRGSGHLVEDRVKAESTLGRRLRAWYKSSPVRLAIKRFLIRAFSFRSRVRQGGRQGGGRPSSASPRDGDYAISWLPIAVPSGPHAKYYAFNLRRLMDCYAGKGAIAESEGYRTILLALRELEEICRGCGARLLVLFAPDAPHVVMPLARERLVPEQVRAFLALKKSDLPPAQETLATLFSNMDAREELIREFCRREGIEFVSLTQALRTAVKGGMQAYFTYDEHWTPPGHRIVAEELYAYLERPPGKP